MRRILPDGFNGAVMAVESITDAAAMMHGPGGCRIRHMVTSSTVFPRLGLDQEPSFLEPYYYGYSRVPATYLDEYDFINGAYYKSEEGLKAVGGREPSLIVIMNSPGAGLIGDDHEKSVIANGLEDRVVRVDEALVSLPCPAGYDHTMRSVLDHLSPEKTTSEGVILIGFSIMEKDWKYARDELVELIECMGLKVRCSPGAGASVDELRDSVNAEYAVVVCPELCPRISGFYESKGLKIVRSDAGAPVGFDAVEAWIRTIAEATGADPSPALAKVKRVREYVYKKFVGMRYNSLRIKGQTFSIAGMSSVVRPLTEWLYQYLAMAPTAVDVDPGYDEKEVLALKEFLASRDYSDSFGKEPVKGSTVVLSEGITALTMMGNGDARVGIPIGYSTMGLDDILPRPVFGTQGVLFILDEILHGVRIG